jgi:hypothetical protein
MDRTYTQADGQAFEEAEQQAARAGYVLDRYNAEMVVKYFDLNPTIGVTAASVKTAIDQMREKNLLHWKSQAQMAYESAAQGLSTQQLATLNSGLAACKMIAEGDEGYSNKTAMIGYLRGRQISHDEIYRGAQYLMGKGVQLFWKPMPSQRANPRGHAVTSENDYKWNVPGTFNTTNRPSHSSNPAFNGERARQQREAERRAGIADPTTESARAMEAYWRGEISKLISTGITHSQRGRLAQIAQTTPGSARQRYAAVKAEADAIRRSRAGGS